MSARESGIGDARRGPATASADASRRDRLASLESAGLDRCRQCRGADAQTAADGAAARSRLLMIGTSPETLGGIAAVVDVYRQAGLFEQWPIRYIATHRDGGALRKCAVAVSAIATFLAELVRDRNAVIHVHCASHASFWRKAVFMAIAHLFGCPVIFHLHGGGFARFHDEECGPLRRRLIRFFLNRATCVVVLSERWRAWIGGVSANPRVLCIPNPVQLPGEMPDLQSRNVVLFLGRICRNKGVFDLLDAIAAMRDSAPGVRLVCAGDGELDTVAGYARHLGIGEVVTLPGWVRAAEKQRLIAQAAVFVLPSYYEGMPMCLLEAMAAAIPVVATAVGGIPDVVTDSVDGFLVRPGDTAALRRILRRLIADRALANRVGAAARRTVCARYAADGIVERLGEIYRRLGLQPRSTPNVPAPRHQRGGDAAGQRARRIADWRAGR